MKHPDQLFGYWDGYQNISKVNITVERKTIAGRMTIPHMLHYIYLIFWNWHIWKVGVCLTVADDAPQIKVLTVSSGFQPF